MTPDPRATLSIVIPVKDDARALAACLASIAAQVEPPHEVVVVDNGSTDDSAAVARAGGARVVPCAERGIPAASATGYDAATGTLIGRIDADCLLPPLWTSRVRRAFEKEPETAAVTGGAHFHDGPPIVRRLLGVLYLVVYRAVATPMLGHVPLFGSNMAMRSSAWRVVREKVHRHDAFLHDDLDLSYHLGRAHRIRVRGDIPVGISIRPFHSARSFIRRTVRALHTVLVHQPQDAPPVRWLRRLRRPPARAAAPSLAAWWI